ncbi:MAG TPA: hypothetical protein VGH14_21540 [Solirubrobacterales bacterium]|jgi:hypothetical protein
MFKKTRKIALIGGVLAVVSYGGSALAAAGAAPVQPTHVAVTAKATADKETADGAQGSGDKETADGAQGSTDTETADGPNFGHEEADEETSDGGSAESETGSEVAGNDGPGGHADEPGNPNAQHEAGGQSEE